jgi:AAA domain
MLNVPDGHVRFYEDGPDWPRTPVQQAAERAYREAFLAAAREAARWDKVDEAAIEAAWGERRKARKRAEVLIPSSVLLGDPRLDSQQIIYVAGHEVDASRTRGRVHGFEFVRQCWDELVEAGVDSRKIRPVIIAPWVEHVAEWAAREIDPERISPPPRPDECLPQEQRRMPEKGFCPAAPAKRHMIIERLTDVTRELLQWLWPGRIPLGKLTLLCGDPGLGKSFVTLDLAARVSRGEPWPDLPLFRTTPGGVVLFNAEDDLGDTIAPRLDKMNANDTRIFAVQGIGGLDAKNGAQWKRSFSLETDLPRLEEMLAEHPDTRLVIIDPISAYTGTVDSHKNAEVRGLLAPLADLAGRHHVAVLSVTHLSKSGGSKAVYRAMGSLAFAAAARAVWAIVKDQDDSQRRLFLPAKLNVAQDPDGLAYRIKDGRVAWEADPIRIHADDAFAAEMRAANGSGNRGSERREAADWLRDELASGPKPASEVIELGEQYGFTERTLRRAYKQIGEKAKKESFDGPWMWRLADPSGHEDTLSL